jgi:hypothetical protein
MKKRPFILSLLLLITFFISAQQDDSIKSINNKKNFTDELFSKEGFGAIASMIATIISVGVAIWSNSQKKKFDKELASFNAKLNEQKADYDALLKERLSKYDARLEYEYEARKRLYKEWEPLIFQLIENSSNAYYRIQSLARTTRENNLDNYNYMGHFGYYFISTIYKLFAPLAIFRLMQAKLTFVDLNLDKKIRVQYSLIKQIYLSWTDDFEFARRASLQYTPNVENWKELRLEHPEVYWRQGLPMGILDITISLLLDKDKQRLLTYGEFETSIVDNTYTNKQIELIRDVLLNFHPNKKPILWQILITQAVLYFNLMKLEITDCEDSVKNSSLIEISNEELSKFLISNFEEGNSKNETILKISYQYLSERLKL